MHFKMHIQTLRCTYTCINAYFAKILHKLVEKTYAKIFWNSVKIL